MAKNFAVLMKVAAIRAYGDVGPLTCYSRKNGKIVFYKRSPPDKPASIKQLHQRARFRIAMIDWKRLTQLNRDTWESISLTTSVPYTGLNLFMMATLRPDMVHQIHTLALQAGYSSLPPYTPR